MYEEDKHDSTQSDLGFCHEGGGDINVVVCINIIYDICYKCIFFMK